jgi:hypothetical protein
MPPTFFSKYTPGINRPADALGFAVFRVVYCGVLLLELRQLFQFQSLVFSEGGWPAGLVTGGLLAWGMALCLLLAGWGTRLAAAANYLLSVAAVWAMPDFKYHLDYIMIGVNFLLLWLPVSATCSLDADWRKRKTGLAAPAWVSSLWVYPLAILPLGLVYLDSVLYKLGSPMWMSGLGFWLPSSLPQNAQTDLSWLLNQEKLVKGIGYGIMIFEAAFLFLIWFRKLRPVLVAAGLLLHAGIGVAYPIPHFSLAMMALYIPLLPDGCWRLLRKAGHWFLGQTTTARRGGSAPRHGLAAAQPAAPPRAGWLYAFLLYCCLGQLLCFTLTPLFQAGARKLGLTTELAALQHWFRPVFFLNQKFLGLVPHDIFLDKHFQDQHQLVSVWYVPPQGPMVPLPLLDAQGQPTGYCSGRVWTKWVSRVTGPGAGRQKLADGLQRFTAFWAGQHRLSLEKATFQVVTKTVAVPGSWQENHLKMQLRKPWQAAGFVRWEQGRCRLQLPGG